MSRASGAVTDELGRCVLVPVANPASVRPLLELAADLVDVDGRILLLTVLRPEATAEERADAWQGMATAESLAGSLGVDARGEVTTHPRLGDAVVAAIRERSASLVLMGWRGASSTTDVFGQLIDHVLGRSSVPLAVVRAGSLPHDRILLPVSDDHLLPGGSGGLGLAVRLAGRLGRRAPRPTAVLRTGRGDHELPDLITALGDRIHHDPRRTHQAVAAFAGPTDLIVAPVAPTVSGLRAATTHLAWAAPDATLLVALDPGPMSGDAEARAPVARSITEAVQPTSEPAATGRREFCLAVTVRLPDEGGVQPADVDRILAAAGRTDHLIAWWPSGDLRPHVRVTVRLEASDLNRAIDRVEAVLTGSAALVGAEFTYDIESDAAESSTTPQDTGVAVVTDDLTVAEDRTGAWRQTADRR